MEVYHFFLDSVPSIKNSVSSCSSLQVFAELASSFFIIVLWINFVVMEYPLGFLDRCATILKVEMGNFTDACCCTTHKVQLFESVELINQTGTSDCVIFVCHNCLLSIRNYHFIHSRKHLDFLEFFPGHIVGIVEVLIEPAFVVLLREAVDERVTLVHELTEGASDDHRVYRPVETAIVSCLEPVEEQENLRNLQVPILGCNDS